MNCCISQKEMNYHGCCCDPSFQRRILTKEEKVELIKQYIKKLEKEKQAAESIIEEMKKDN